MKSFPVSDTPTSVLFTHTFMEKLQEELTWERRLVGYISKNLLLTYLVYILFFL